MPVPDGPMTIVLLGPNGHMTKTMTGLTTQSSSSMAL